MEITGIAEDPAERKKASLATIACCDTKNLPEGIDMVPPPVLELLREQCLIVQSSASSLYRAARLYAANRTSPSSLTVNALEYSDGNELTLAAIDQGKLDGNGYSSLTVHSCFASLTYFILKRTILLCRTVRRQKSTTEWRASLGVPTSERSAMQR